MHYLLYIVDEIMGGGKSCAAINFVREHGGTRHFLYVTPYISEVHRVQDACECVEIAQPSDEHSCKLTDIKKLFRTGKNIVSTHALFARLDAEAIDLIRKGKYVLVIDEAPDAISQFEIAASDIQMLLGWGVLAVNPNGILKLGETEYRGGAFSAVRDLAGAGCLGLHRDSAVIQLFPVDVFRAFCDIYMLTYMYNAQPVKYYFDLFGFERTMLGVAGDAIENYRFSDVRTGHGGQNFANLITILENDKLNAVGEKRTALSAGWYARQRDLKCLKNNCYNFFNNIMHTKSNENLWTTFAEYRGKIRGNGYVRGFAPMNVRAVNEFGGCTAVAYLVNRYYNPFVKRFLQDGGLPVDEDAFAVSEMVQFIWRSAIRNGKPIVVYVPSSRMRELLQKWLKGEIT